MTNRLREVHFAPLLEMEQGDLTNCLLESRDVIEGFTNMPAEFESELCGCGYITEDPRKSLRQAAYDNVKQIIRILNSKGHIMRG